MKDIYDLIIIGAGPAGITAAIYAARKGMNFMIIALEVGGQVMKNAFVDNYTGYQEITGVELTSKFEEHLKDYKITVKEQKVRHVELLAAKVLKKGHPPGISRLNSQKPQFHPVPA